MAKYIIKKIAIAVVTLFLVIFILFLLMELMPGSPFNDPKLTDEQKQVMMQAYGLDKPVLTRFLIYVKNIFHGDFGVSYNLAADVPVSELISTRLPISMLIGLAALILGSISGLALGFSAAFKKGKAWDLICKIISIISISVPAYIFAILFSYYWGYKFKFLPLLYDFRSPILSSLMAVIALSIFVMGVVMRYTRDESVTVLNSDYVLFARSQGISKKTLLFKYVIRNSFMPIITVITMLLVGLLTGSMVTESIFAVPGIGFLLTSAVSANDYNVVIALSFVFALIYVVARLVLDILYGLIDPRVRVSGKAN